MLFPRTLVTSGEGAVSPHDLKRLGDLHALLFVLDDPTAALGEVTALCARLPALEARILALANTAGAYRRTLDLRTALSLVGNRGLERVLLELLEDLTVLKADLDEQR